VAAGAAGPLAASAPSSPRRRWRGRSRGGRSRVARRGRTGTR